jgi:hypothetical protein
MWGQTQTNTFPPTGSVGIGTTNPIAPLDVHVGTDQNMIIGTYQGAPYLQSVNDAANAVQPLQLIGSKFLLYGFGTTAKVGIGTLSPAAALHVALPIPRATAFDAGNANTWADTILSNPIGSVGPATGIGFDVDPVALQGNQTVLSGIAAVRTNANSADGGSDLVFISRPVGFTSEERMRITGAGNVGIGTTNPTNKLSVAGTVQAYEVYVNSGWSDYVFAPDYRLRDLADVSAYIRQNHHLPEIPSAAEVQEKGVGIGDMQAKLLAKVEELTLHMIQEHERNDRLAQENQQLQARIARIETLAAGTAPAPVQP